MEGFFPTITSPTVTVQVQCSVIVPVISYQETYTPDWQTTSQHIDHHKLLRLNFHSLQFWVWKALDSLISFEGDWFIWVFNIFFSFISHFYEGQYTPRYNWYKQKCQVNERWYACDACSLTISSFSVVLWGLWGSSWGEEGGGRGGLKMPRGSTDSSGESQFKTWTPESFCCRHHTGWQKDWKCFNGSSRDRFFSPPNSRAFHSHWMIRHINSSSYQSRWRRRRQHCASAQDWVKCRQT